MLTITLSNRGTTFKPSVSFQIYYVFFLHIEKDQKGRGFGGALVEQLNNFLNSKGKAGILRNIIDQQNPAFSIYENRGWKPIENNEDWLIYNPPKNLTPGRIDKAIKGIKDMEKDGKFLPRLKNNVEISLTIHLSKFIQV